MGGTAESNAFRPCAVQMQQRAKSFLCGKSGKKKYRIRTEQERNEIQMKAQLEAIEKKAFEELTAAQDLKDLDAVRVKYLGKRES